MTISMTIYADAPTMETVMSDLIDELRDEIEGLRYAAKRTIVALRSHQNVDYAIKELETELNRRRRPSELGDSLEATIDAADGQ